MKCTLLCKSDLNRTAARLLGGQNVSQVGSFAELDKLTTDNKDKLIVVDYSTTWCGPCKMILPKFEALAEEYADAIFVKVGGVLSPQQQHLD